MFLLLIFWNSPWTSKTWTNYVCRPSQAQGIVFITFSTGASGLEDLCVLVSFLLHVLFSLFPLPHELFFCPGMNFGLLLPLSLPGGYHLLVLSANLVSQVPQLDKLSRRLQTHNLRAVETTVHLFLSEGGGLPSNTFLVRMAWPCCSGGQHASTVHQKMQLGPDGVGATGLVGVHMLSEKGQVC